MRWRLLLTPAMDGVGNMALDEALMARVRESNEGVVRVYSWVTPTLSLGRNQRAEGAYSAARARALGVDVVRRATGGRALFHHREITYSVTAPVPANGSLRESYHAVNCVLLATLSSLGVGAEVAEQRERLPPPGSAPCFELPANGELMFAGRKLVGSAQYRADNAMLQHGSILVHDDQFMVARIASLPIADIPGAASLVEALGYEPTAREFADALFRIVRRDWDSGATPLPMDDALAVAAAGARRRYLDDRWTWRR